MDRIDINEAIQRANILYKALIRRETYQHDVMSFKNYKWIMGHKIYKALEKEFPLRFSTEERPTLFSIPVEVTMSDPEALELWENITDKL